MTDFFLNVKTPKEDLDKAEDGAVINGCLVLKYDKYKNQQFKDREDITAVYAPNATIIPSMMFDDCCNIERVFLPEVVEVADDAFWGCKKLKQLIAPRLSLFGESAFSGCFALDLSKIFPVTQRQIDDAEDGDLISFHLILKKESYLDCDFNGRHDFMFVHAANLKKVSKVMFYGCSNLQSINCPLVETVEEGGFEDCFSLKRMSA